MASKKYYLLISCVLFLFALCLLYCLNIRINITPSMPRGFYQIVYSQISHDDIISFCLDSESFTTLALEREYLHKGSCKNGSEPLVKIVRGLPGDLIDISSNGIFINGQLLTESKILSTDHCLRPLPPSELKSGIIPYGMALVLSDHHSGGFDSRYFGLVKLSSLQKVQPLWIF